MDRNYFQASGVNLTQVNMNTQNINNLTRAFMKLKRDYENIINTEGGGGGGGGSSTSFINLSDTPSVYGTPGQFVCVNTAGNGLTFTSGTGVVTSLAALTDTAISLPPAAGQLINYDANLNRWVNVTNVVLPGTLSLASTLAVIAPGDIACTGDAVFGGGTTFTGNILQAQGATPLTTTFGGLVSCIQPNQSLIIEPTGAVPAVVHSLGVNVAFAGSDFAIFANNTPGTTASLFVDISTTPSRLGINTSTPAYELEINGNLAVMPNPTAASQIPVIHAGPGFGVLVTGIPGAAGNLPTTAAGAFGVIGDSAFDGEIRLWGAPFKVGTTTNNATGGIAGQYLKSTGNTSAPEWVSWTPNFDSYFVKANTNGSVSNQKVYVQFANVERKIYTVGGSVPVGYPTYVSGAAMGLSPAQGSNEAIWSPSVSGIWKITTHITYQVPQNAAAVGITGGVGIDLDNGAPLAPWYIEYFPFFVTANFAAVGASQTFVAQGSCVVRLRDTDKIKMFVQASGGLGTASSQCTILSGGQSAAPWLSYIDFELLNY